MRLRFTPLVFCLALGWSGQAAAQVPDWVNQLLSAAELPIVALQVRQAGVPNDQIRTALEALRTKGVRANEARDIFDEERSAAREHGPVDNFGAFVQSKLDAGLRGRDLAAAIRAEHAARGIGRGNAKGMGQPSGVGSGAKGAPPGMPRGMGQPGGVNPGAGKTGMPEKKGNPAAAAKGAAGAEHGKGRPSGRPDKPNL